MTQTASKSRKSTGKAASNGSGTPTDAVRDVADSVVGTVRDQSTKLADTAHEVAQKGVTQAAAVQDTARDTIRSNPGLAVGAAFGVGLLIGLAMHNRS